MSKERLSTVQAFTERGIVFRCWIVTDDEGHERFEWKSDDNVCRVGTNVGNAMKWGACRGRVIGTHYVTLKAAMEAVSKAYERATKAA